MGMELYAFKNPRKMEGQTLVISQEMNNLRKLCDYTKKGKIILNSFQHMKLPIFHSAHNKTTEKYDEFLYKYYAKEWRILRGRRHRGFGGGRDREYGECLITAKASKRRDTMRN